MRFACTGHEVYYRSTAPARLPRETDSMLRARLDGMWQDPARHQADGDAVEAQRDPVVMSAWIQAGVALRLRRVYWPLRREAEETVRDLGTTEIDRYGNVTFRPHRREPEELERYLGERRED